MIEVNCVICKNELTEKGAILLSPPSIGLSTILDIKTDVCAKFHVCVTCYKKIIQDYIVGDK